MKDLSLEQGAKTGALFAELVAAYEARIFRFICGLVRDRELARDLTQETFLSAYRAVNKPVASAEFAPWLYTIAKNHAFSALRRRRLIAWLPLTRHRDSGEEAPTWTDSAGDPADTVLARERLKEALGRLDVESRTVVLLAAEGFSYQEIAQTMGCGVGAVRQRLFRARRQLRSQHLGRELGHE